jgi:hypothetical protein
MHLASSKIGSLAVKYNANSTGWGGYTRDTILWMKGVQAVGSKTAGMLAINLDRETPTLYRFNRSSASALGMMDESDIQQLNLDLRRLLLEKKITPEQCLEILDSLADVSSENGPLCLITRDCLYLRDLRNQCLRV